MGFLPELDGLHGMTCAAPFYGNGGLVILPDGLPLFLPPTGGWLVYEGKAYNASAEA